MGKRTTQKKQGVHKRVSDAVYFKDIVSDGQRRASLLETRGAWDDTWFTMAMDGAYEMIFTVRGWARFWGCTTQKARKVIRDMQDNKVCDVTLCNKNVTLKSRRLARKHEVRTGIALRVKKYRQKEVCNSDVTSEKVLPSSSSSLSSSLKDFNDSCTEPEKAPASVPPELAGLELYEVDNKLLKKWAQLTAAWKASCPGVNIKTEVAKAHAWEIANPQRRKKDRGRFLNTWLSKAQDSPVGKPQANTGSRNFDSAYSQKGKFDNVGQRMEV